MLVQTIIEVQETMKVVYTGLKTRVERFAVDVLGCRRHLQASVCLPRVLRRERRPFPERDPLNRLAASDEVQMG